MRQLVLGRKEFNPPEKLRIETHFMFVNINLKKPFVVFGTIDPDLYLHQAKQSRKVQTRILCGDPYVAILFIA